MKKFPAKCEKNLFGIFFAFHRCEMIFPSRVVVDLHKPVLQQIDRRETAEKGASLPRLLIRKHKKVSKINVFKGREHGTKSKNLILTGTKGADVKISALRACPHLKIYQSGCENLCFFLS